MQPKPKHLMPEYGAQWQDRSMAEAYPHRPPYPAGVFGALRELAGAHGAVLDVGTGCGDISRGLTSLVGRVDAVDASAAMIAQGRRQPGGEAANLHWQHATVEEAALSPPYALITAGESLHWLDWAVVFPRFVAALSPGGMLAIIGRDWAHSAAMWAREHPIIARYTTNRDFQPYNLLDELTSRGLFERRGQRRIGPEPWLPTIAEYIECRHSQNGLSRERMGGEAAAYDAAMRELLVELCREGVIETRDDRLVFAVTATITWGRPLRP